MLTLRFRFVPRPVASLGTLQFVNCDTSSRKGWYSASTIPPKRPPVTAHLNAIPCPPGTLLVHSPASVRAYSTKPQYRLHPPPEGTLLHAFCQAADRWFSYRILSPSVREMRVQRYNAIWEAFRTQPGEEINAPRPR
jgi:hypothetical protein